MTSNRLFNLIVAAVLLSMTALTVHQAWATVQGAPSPSNQSAEGNDVLASGFNLTGASPHEALAYRWQALADFYAGQVEAAEKQCPFSAAEQRSLRAEYLNGKGPWVANSESGYAGRQGGALALLGC